MGSYGAGLVERWEQVEVDAEVGDPGRELMLRAGGMGDYAKLAGFHYLSSKPVTATRVLVLEDRRPSVAGRFLCRKEETQVVGVVVESYPALSCRLREVALGERYAGIGDRRMRARLLNQEVRCLSRVVVHPQWRGLGLAVRLVKAALAGAETPYVEALAAMGQVHPFFRLAGMREYRRQAHRKDQRLMDALASAGVEPWRLADGDGVRAWMEEEGAGQRLVKRELARWAGKKGATCEAMLDKARAELLGEPVYYLWGE